MGESFLTRYTCILRNSKKGTLWKLESNRRQTLVLSSDFCLSAFPIAAAAHTTSSAPERITCGQCRG